MDRKINKEDFRQMTKNNLQSELYKILNNYMLIYDEYYETNSRDSAFLKDLVDCLQGISTVLEVYTRDGKINSDYAIEKLKNSRSYIDMTISYFESCDDLYKLKNGVEFY